MMREPLADAIRRMSREELEGVRWAHEIIPLKGDDLVALIERERELGVTK